MLIGVVSDTHRNRFAVLEVFEFFKSKGVSTVLHLGDTADDVKEMDGFFGMEVVTIQGNTDFPQNGIEEVIYEAEGVRILMTHGHLHQVRRSLNFLARRARETDCSVALFGHTHVPYNNMVGDVLVLNPGSPYEPREGSKRSCAIIEVKDGKAKGEVFLL